MTADVTPIRPPKKPRRKYQWSAATRRRWLLARIECSVAKVKATRDWANAGHDLFALATELRNARPRDRFVTHAGVRFPIRHGTIGRYVAHPDTGALLLVDFP